MTNPENRPLRVFLCHAKDDKPSVRPLYTFLLKNGVDAWLDEEKLLPGQDWQLEITKAIGQSDIIVVCLSKHSITKEGFVQKEIRFALDRATEMPEGTIFIIPARLEECEVPHSLVQWQWLDLFGEHGGERLIRGLSARAETLGLKIARAPLGDPRTKNSPSTSKSSPPKKTAQAKTPAVPRESASVEVRTWAGIEFVKVPASNFIMGAHLTDRYNHASETPKHIVNIPYEYWIGRFPITNAQFSEFVGWTHYPFKWVSGWKQKLDHPVINVSWNDALAYLSWLGRVRGEDLPKGMSFDLPSEAEWEKAARGTDGRVFPWGNDFDQRRCNASWLHSETYPVGAYCPLGDSPYGACDMAGGIWEWTKSDNKPYPYKLETEGFPKSYEAVLIVRGGPYKGSEASVRTTKRFISSTEPMQRPFSRREYAYSVGEIFEIPHPQGLRVVCRYS